MRETVRSMRIYLFLSGALSSLIYLSHVVAADSSLVARAVASVGLVTAAGLLYVAVAIRSLLVEAPGRILGILHANMAYAAVILALSLVALGANGGAGKVVFGLLILVYLRANVIRLAKEESASAETVAA